MTDVVNKEGRRFGMENLKNVLNTKPDLQPEEVLAEVRHSVMESFSDGAEQYDDITILCISALYKERLKFLRWTSAALKSAKDYIRETGVRSLQLLKRTLSEKGFLLGAWYSSAAFPTGRIHTTSYSM